MAAQAGEDEVKDLCRFNTPQISNVVASHPGSKHSLNLYNPWQVAWYTDTSVRAVAGLESGVRRCGYAVTCLSGVPDPNYTCGPQWGDVLEAIEASPKPVVLIIQQRYPAEVVSKAALFGGKMAVCAKQLGCVGVVSDGPHRDADEIRDMGGLGCIATGLTPGHGKMGFLAVNVPVSVAGMDVAPGEIVHMDEHGAVKFPATHTRAVAEKCAALQEEEDEALAKVRSASSAREIRQIMAGGKTAQWAGSPAP
eukprot:TRINITY_DN35849_c0_g1_i1.p2 TRINITY_DN35849_c0_g1~~TRINITY_DN35849_c0_g1_i1.p2  ORF type:complete len:252 (+),score=72.80 TRINITY_DN35849_c0_g1_i1:47-802(+)